MTGLAFCQPSVFPRSMSSQTTDLDYNQAAFNLDPIYSLFGAHQNVRYPISTFNLMCQRRHIDPKTELASSRNLPHINLKMNRPDIGPKTTFHQLICPEFGTPPRSADLIFSSKAVAATPSHSTQKNPDFPALFNYSQLDSKY